MTYRSVSRRHYDRIYKAFDRFQRRVGQTLIWYEFDREHSTRGDVYDEGPGRAWQLPKPIPVLGVVRVEGREVPRPEGLYTVDTIHVVASVEQLRRSGLSNATDAIAHLNDRFVWDGFVWEIRTYQIRGRMQTLETVVGIDATRVSPEEMVNDVHVGGTALPLLLNSDQGIDWSAYR